MELRMVDTHKSFKGLIAAGFNEEQAEKIIEAIQNIDYSVVATKSDLQAVKDDLRSDLQAVKNDLQTVKDDLLSEINKVANNSLKFLIIQTITIVGVMVALFALSL